MAKRKRSNCLIVALTLWWRHEGGYLLFRGSLHRLLSFHVAWSPDAYRFVAYVPNTPNDGFWPMLLFHGHFVRWRGVEPVHPGRRRVGYLGRRGPRTARLSADRGGPR